MAKFKHISIEEAMVNKSEYIFFDVRSESEFAEDHILGAVNLPLLDDNERKIIGTIYKEKGNKLAKEKAREMVLPRSLVYLNSFHKAAKDNSKIIIYCARGGDRSEVTATLLSLELDNVYKLSGGYKSYRNYILNYFEKDFNKKLRVLYGLTGCGKTELLKLLKEKKMPVIDLEGLANNRGSVFGHIGLGAQPSQKKFDSDLFNSIISIENEYIIVEGESKKIGRLYIPNGFYDKMINGESYLIESNINNRTKRIIKDYGGFLDENKDEIVRSINVLKDFLGKKVAAELVDSFNNKEAENVVSYLLINYYDILYNKNRKNNNRYKHTYDTNDMDACVNSIIKDFV